MSRQVEYQARAREVFAIAKEHRDAVAAVLPDQDRKRFLVLTSKSSGRPSQQSKPPKNSG